MIMTVAVGRLAVFFTCAGVPIDTHYTVLQGESL